MAANNPFPLPADLSPILHRILSYWESLKRGDNDMPFWDDVKPSALAELAGNLLLIDVFAEPERFRFNTIGTELMHGNGGALAGKFADEVALSDGLKYLRAQCSATVEARKPTFYRHVGGENGAGFTRVLMPMWGNGRIGMLLGAVELH
jgi:hypothetical protein